MRLSCFLGVYVRLRALAQNFGEDSDNISGGTFRV